MRIFSFALALVYFTSCGTAAESGTASGNAAKTVVVIFDGLRPDFITAEWMPNLHRLKSQASYAADNHSVFPTVTRVNSSSFSTGSYPATHGIMGNSVHIRAFDNDQVYNTSNMSELRIIDSLSGGKLLSAVTAGEVLQNQGKRLYVFSSGSTGQAFLQNPRVGGAIIHPEFILPESLDSVVKSAIGEPDGSLETRFAKHAWVTDAFLAFGLVADGPEVSTVWYSEPDAAQHGTGIGSPKSLEAIRFMDQQLGRILEALKERGLSDQLNLIVTADHGFISYEGDQTIVDFLIQKGFKESRESNDVIIADGALFVKDRNPEKIAALAKLLQEQDWIGPLFTRAEPGHPTNGILPGTLAFDVIHWAHPDRAADILVTYHWTDQKNEYGFKGRQVSKSRAAAGHGGISTHEIRTPMILSGPAFKKAYISHLPSSFIDIMPTVLALHGATKPEAMDGRVLGEIFIDTDPDTLPEVVRETITREVNLPTVTYHVEVGLSTVNGYRYLDFGRAVRAEN